MLYARVKGWAGGVEGWAGGVEAWVGRVEAWVGGPRAGWECCKGVVILTVPPLVKMGLKDGPHLILLVAGRWAGRLGGRV